MKAPILRMGGQPVGLAPIPYVAGVSARGPICPAPFTFRAAMEMTMSNRQIEPVGEHQTAALPGTILALDLGTTTGWALRSVDGLITSGTASFTG